MPKVMLVLLALTAVTTHAAPGGDAQYFPCRSCHGDKGQGSPAIHAPALAGQSEDYLARQLRYFNNGKRGSHAQDTWGKQMALMAANLSETNITHLAALIAGMPPWPAGQGQSDVDSATTKLYTNCVVCHGPSGQGRAEVKAPRIGGLDSTYLATQLRNFRDGIRGSDDRDIPGQQMRAALPEHLDDTAIEKLARYIQAM